MERKLKYNQYFTTGNILQYPQIVEFIENAKFEQVLDPFAGSGNLNILDTQFIGFDVDGDLCKKYGWKCNDSLINIPTQEKETLIITNPPYKAKNVCKRMGSDLYNYFINHENYTNLSLTISELAKTDAIVLRDQSMIFENMFQIIGVDDPGRQVQQ